MMLTITTCAHLQQTIVYVHKFISSMQF